ncbi:hypothetical protein [Escherichia coli]|uniref:hypothetical protein n=1 Tax=Escherichia coli TaxID=562 RepID=UPI0039C8A339
MIFDKLNHLLSPIANTVTAFLSPFAGASTGVSAAVRRHAAFYIFCETRRSGKADVSAKDLNSAFHDLFCFRLDSASGRLVFYSAFMAGKISPVRRCLRTMALLFTVAGFILHVVLRRLISPEFDKVKRGMVKKTSMERDRRTDVRRVKEILPVTTEYDPMDYIDLNKGIFIGLSREGEPQYIPLKEWQTQHADIIGTTGAGKGVVTGILLYQSILADEGVFVLDPKNDEWAPHLYKKACADAGKPFVLIDLNKQEYQMNLIDGITADHLEELFVAGFSLAEKARRRIFTVSTTARRRERRRSS